MSGHVILSAAKNPRRRLFGVLLAGAILAACGGAPTAAPAAPSSQPASVAASSSEPAASGSAAAKPAGSSAGAASAKPASSAAASAKPAGSTAASAKPAASAAAGAVRGAYASLSATQVVPWTSEGSGLFKKEGVDVSLAFISPATLTAGLLSNNLDLAYGPGNAVATVESQGGDLIAVGGPFSGPQFSMVADKSVATLKDLKGKTITVTQRGSSADLLVADLMKQQGYGPGDYNVVYIPTPADELAAFGSGSANAIVTGEPTASQAVGLGGHVILAAKDTGGKYNTLSVLMLRKSYLAGHRDQVKRVLMANMEAAHIIKTNPDQVAQAIAKQYLKIDDVSVVTNSVKAVAPFVNQDMTFQPEAMQNIIDETATTVPAVANLKVQDLVDFSVIDEIKASGFLDTLK